jgi:sulfate adenylyltransferase subunit 1 (EFTu-like GTPase family)
MSVALRFTTEIDVSRGDMLVEADDQPTTARELEAHICWMSDQPLAARGKYVIKHTTRSARAIVEEIEHRIDINSLEHVKADQLGLNEIGRVRLRCSAPLVVDPYSRNRTTGSFILIDESTNDTVAAGMIINAKG